ncbi:zinc finger protein 366-like isoform X1 [Myxocyprinus asiaticus]|uniref:zinc finger protein 366-like isoform X1 n=1 Tax=Myxocyprinus asiaticus TaxID=70543 RepID=UPI00222143E6|nr:zinc finger protein 366-like isoform X1 [Myxocyprinus asiaticus]XP_051524470.1 zinc finger protein 366-like isoform X1 [Myxocyprinus asiaticus]
MDLKDNDGKQADDCTTRTVDLSLLPYPLPHPNLPQPHRYAPGMIDLNRLRLHRVIGRYDGIKVKQEMVKPLPLWPASPLLVHSPSPYFSPFHPSLVPFPFLLPGSIPHLSPNTFYQSEAFWYRRRGQEGSKSTLTNAEKPGLSVHVDDSYYVDVGHNQKRWKCRMCEKSYTSKYNLITHILGHSGIKPHGCTVCGKLFKQLSHLHTHMLTHQGARPHKCQVCHKAFTQTSHLKRHMMQHSDIKPYSCNVCARGFAYPSELRAHELKHERGQENICVECGLDFPTLAQLKRHLTAHRGPVQYDCSECGKSFQYPSQLQNHMMKHKDIRPFICSECGMEFVQSHHLKQHTLTHKGVKEHKCRICGREFTLLANMKRHVLIHTNIRAYQCHLCYKSFIQKQTLKAHMIVHSEIKPYKCKLCGKQFNRMHNLMGHMHMHSDSKPFKCLYCTSKFTLKGNLTRHMKVKHGIMDQGLDARVFRRCGRLCLSGPLRILSRIRQEEPFDLSQKAQGQLRLSQSDGESVRGGSSSREEDEDSLYRMSQYSPDIYNPALEARQADDEDDGEDEEAHDEKKCYDDQEELQSRSYCESQQSSVSDAELDAH